MIQRKKTINAFQIISNFFFQVEKWSKETPNGSNPMYKTNPKSTQKIRIWGKLSLKIIFK